MVSHSQLSNSQESVCSFICRRTHKFLWLVVKLHQGRQTSSQDNENGWIHIFILLPCCHQILNFCEIMPEVVSDISLCTATWKSLQWTSKLTNLWPAASILIDKKLGILTGVGQATTGNSKKIRLDGEESKNGRPKGELWKELVSKILQSLD